MFTFSVDVAGTLANDRQAMWQETRSNFESGAYGDPTSLDTLIMYWTTMNKLHYPCAPDALKLLEARQKQEQEMLRKQQQDALTAEAFANAKIPELMRENANLQEQMLQQQEQTQRQKAAEENQKVDEALSSIGL